MLKKNMDTTKPKVLIAVPTEGGNHERLTIWLSTVIRNRPDLIPASFRGRPADYVRNTIVRYFLAGDYTHLLFIDSDTEPPLDAVDRLLTADKPVISGCYPVMMTDGINWALSDRDAAGHYRLTKKLHDKNNPFRIDAAGAGCLMIRRDVLEQIDWPWFRWVENRDGSQMSEDIFFFDKLHAAGIDLWANPQVVCNHYKQVNLTTLKQLIDNQIAAGIARPERT